MLVLYPGAFSNNCVKPLHRLCCMFGKNKPLCLRNFDLALSSIALVLNGLNMKIMFLAAES